MEFVAAVTDAESPDFVPERDRVAVSLDDVRAELDPLKLWNSAPLIKS